MNIAIKTWPAYKGMVSYFYNSYNTIHDDCGSVWIYLRDIPKDDLSDSEKSDVANLGLYVWFNKDGTYLVQPKMRDVHSADLRTLEGMTKQLRKMCKAVPEVFVKGDLEQILMDTMKALGIKYAFEYGPEPKLASVEPAVKEIARTVEEIKRRSFNV